MGAFKQRAISAIRGKLSELNIRYDGGIDFQLHESQHLELYRQHTSGMAHDRHHGHYGHHGRIGGGGGGLALRTVISYTLVIQKIDGGAPSIPPPHVLAEQAFQMGNRMAPSAPLVVS